MKTALTLLALCLTTMATIAQNPADEKAIKNVIAGESAAFYQRNADKVLSYWANVPYASHSYTEKGMGYLRGYDAVSKAIKKYISGHPDLGRDVHKTHDFRIHVNGNSALATFITDAVSGTKKSQSYDARYLEKVKGAWKLVSVYGTPAP
ncbi:Cif family virulence factor [Spirosoma areae]